MSDGRRCHVVVLGNEKGGTGKSTSAMHLIAALLHEGHSVGAIDLDTRQGTLSRYLSNRLAYGERFGVPLLQPETGAFAASPLADRHAAEAADVSALNDALAALAYCDYVVIDTPGSSEPISRAGHARADTLISPINDSFVDLDLLADVDPETFRVLRPSRYAEMVWEMRKARALRDRGTIDWIVMRNRLASLESRNMRRMDEVLRALAARVGFRLAPGFGERVIFRELFLKGLTLLDLKEGGVELTLSHVAARNEVRGLLRAIGLGRFPGRESAAPRPLAAEAGERTL